MKSVDASPVLVGAAALSQRVEDPAEALEPVELMTEATRRAAEDAGARALLSRADSIRVPRGFWPYPDPGRIIAERIGATSARTVIAEVGVLQTSLLGQAALDIANGSAEVVLIAGAEAKYRALRAQITGAKAPLLDQGNTEPDEILRPSGAIMHPAEVEHGLIMPVQQYSMVENALRAEAGISLDAHRDEVARMWSAMSEVAADNPAAWSRERLSATTIRNAGNGNRMLAFPYTKHHNSQWNVDQAACLILCASATARAAGIPESRWVYPWVVTESNHMLALCERANPQRCPGFEITGRRAFEIAEMEVTAAAHREIYSCFPSAVRVQARELGLDLHAPLTETGGMTFAGGPLNNFVLQAMARMTQVLRGDPGSLGLVTAVSGILTKQGVTLWSTAPPSGPFRFEDLSEASARATPTAKFEARLAGPARVVTYTVPYEGEEPVRGLALCEMEDGRRTLASTEDRALATAMTQEEFCGRTLEVRDGKLC